MRGARKLLRFYALAPKYLAGDWNKKALAMLFDRQIGALYSTRWLRANGAQWAFRCQGREGRVAQPGLAGAGSIPAIIAASERRPAR